MLCFLTFQLNYEICTYTCIYTNSNITLRALASYIFEPKQARGNVTQLFSNNKMALIWIPRYSSGNGNVKANFLPNRNQKLLSFKKAKLKTFPGFLLSKIVPTILANQNRYRCCELSIHATSSVEELVWLRFQLTANKSTITPEKNLQ